MTLQEIINQIIHSDSNDWNNIACWGAGSGPSYKDMFEFYNAFNGNENVLTHKSHSNICVYKSNITITIAYGLSFNDDDNGVTENWATNNPDSSPGKLYYADIFFNNGLVHRVDYCVVDGGRCKIPYPHHDNNGNLIVERQYSDFIRKLNELSGTMNYNIYFDRTGINVIEATWQ